MPTPTEGETRAEFMERCIPDLIENENRDQDQAAAMCMSFWEEDSKMKINGMEHKTVPFEVSALDTVGRTLEGYASIFGNVDGGGDVVHPGAFSKTLQERAEQVKFLWQHDPREPLGKPVEIREDSRGLFVKAVISDTQKGRDAIALLADNAIDGLSIGYEPVKGGTDFTPGKDDEQIRNLRELKLFEFSLVTFPMNEAAQVTALKEDEQPGIAEDTEPPEENALEPDTEEKAGRVLARRNADRIAGALAALVEVLEDAGIEMGARDDDDDEKEKQAPATEQAAPQEAEPTDAPPDDGPETHSLTSREIALHELEMLNMELELLEVM